MTGLDPAQTGKVTAALDTKGIGYELQNNGTALAVEKGKTAEARIALAGAGLSGSTAQPGYELLDRQKLGTSNFQQQVNYQRALEGEIAKTIEQVDGVGGAQVQLVLPDREAQLFSDEASPATAAVLLSGATALDPGSVRGIAQLVANSVPGLQTDKVTITDGSGQLLWPNGSGGGRRRTAAGCSPSRRPRRATTSRSASAISAMLARTLGPDKAQVQVHADLDANEATREELTYGRRGVALQSKTERESLRGGERRRRRDGRHRRQHARVRADRRRRQIGLQTRQQRRHVRRRQDRHAHENRARRDQQPAGLRAARQIGARASALPQIRAAVASAAGIDARRGDVLTVGQVAFARPPVAAAPSPVATYGGYLKYVFVGLAALGFLLFVTRQLKRRESETLAARADVAVARSRRRARSPSWSGSRPTTTRRTCARCARPSSPRGCRSRTSSSATPTASRSRCARGWRRTTVVAADRRHRRRRGRGRHAGAGRACRRRSVPRLAGRQKAAVLLIALGPEQGGRGLQAPARGRDRVALAGDGEVGPDRARHLRVRVRGAGRRRAGVRLARDRRRRLRARGAGALAGQRPRGGDHRPPVDGDRAPPVRVPAPHAGRPHRHVPARRVAADDRARRREPAHDARRAGALVPAGGAAGRHRAADRAHGRDAARRRARDRERRCAASWRRSCSRSTRAAGGVKSLAEILNHTDRPTERNVLDTIAEEDSELGEEVRRLLFVFEDIAKTRRPLDPARAARGRPERSGARAARRRGGRSRSACCRTCPSAARRCCARRWSSSRRRRSASSRRRRAASSASCAASRTPARS